MDENCQDAERPVNPTNVGLRSGSGMSARESHPFSQVVTFDLYVVHFRVIAAVFGGVGVGAMSTTPDPQRIVW